MHSTVEAYRGALSYDAMVAAAATNAELFRIARRNARVPAEYGARIAATRRTWHFLSVSEDWCGDSVNVLPWVDALAAEVPGMTHRIIRRDENLELMDAHLTNGRTRSIPIVLLLDDRFEERAWWGPRPRALQAWFEGAEAQAMTKDERYKVLRTHYARDRGRAILEELTALTERVSAQAAGAGSAATTSSAAP